MTDIGTRVKNLRLSNNKTAKELSSIINLSQSSISKLENNQRGADITTLEKICEAFNVSLSDFFNDEIRAEETKLISITKTLKSDQVNLLIEIAKNFK